MLNTDIVASDIPLLLSRKPMKKADKNLDYKRNLSTIFDEPSQLVVTKSGQYVIPINPLKGILNHVKKKGIITNMALSTTENTNWKKDTSLKIQWQFVHPSTDILLKMLTWAGNLWQTDR